MLISVLSEEWRCLVTDPPAEEKYLYQEDQQGLKHSISVLIDQKIESRQPTFISFIGWPVATASVLTESLRANK